MALSRAHWAFPNHDARRAIEQAQRMAKALGHGEAGTDALLVGLQSDQTSSSAKLLAAVGWPSPPASAAADPSDDGVWPPLGPEVCHVVEAAYGAARRCGQSYVGTEHLLIALAEQPGPSLGARFAQHGLTTTRVGDAAERVCGWAGMPRYAPPAQDVLFAAEQEAAAAGRDIALVVDLVAALADCADGAVSAAFSRCSVTAETLRSGVAEHVPARTERVARVRYGDVLLSSLNIADLCAGDLGFDRVGPEHLLFGALAVGQHWVEDLLKGAGTSSSALRASLPRIEAGSIRARTPFWEAFSADSHQVLLRAARGASSARDVAVLPHHVVHAALAVLPEELAERLAALGLGREQAIDAPVARSHVEERCLPFSEELATGLTNSLAAWRDQGRLARVSPMHLLLGLLGDNGTDIQAWLEERGVTPWDAMGAVTRHALRGSWTDEARQVWRDATAVARDHQAAQVGLAYVLWALAGSGPAFPEQRVLVAHGLSSDRLNEFLGDAANPQRPPERPDAGHDGGLPLDHECQQLCKAAVEVAAQAKQLRVDRSDLVRALGAEQFETVRQLGLDCQAFGEHLRAPESLWDAHEQLAASTREVAALRAIHGANHIATVSANDKRLAAMLELGFRPKGGETDPRMLMRLARAMWAHLFHGWLATWRHRRLRLWRPVWGTAASRRELGDVLRVLTPWQIDKLQPDGAFPLDSTGRQGLAEFDKLLVRYDDAIADAEASGADWQLGGALLNRADVLDAIGRFPEARADRERFGTVISEDDDASSLLWMRGQTSLQQIHETLDGDPVVLSRAERRQARWLVLGIRAMTFLDFWLPWAFRDPRLRDSRHSAGALLPRTQLAAILLRSGAARAATRELRRITRARRRFHRSRHPQTLSAEVVLAHARLVATKQSGVSRTRNRWRLWQAWRSIRRTRELHVTWLGPGHPLTLRVQTLAVDALSAQGRVAEALDAAVDGIAAADAARYRFDDTRTREGWRNVYAGLMRRALTLAQTTAQSNLVVELIEAARGQGVPIARDERVSGPHVVHEPRYTAPGSTSLDRLGLSAGLALIADVPVAPMGHVRLSGEASRLDSVKLGDIDRSQGSRERGELDSLISEIVGTEEATISGPAAVDLISLARSVTGHRDPWLWGSWDVDAAVVSYLIRPGSTDDSWLIDTFTEPLTMGGEPTALGQALDAFSEAMITDDEQSRQHGVEAFVGRSDLTRWIGSERRLLTNLGLSVIPPPLREEAKRRADHNDDPIALVVMPAPSCARLPLAALAVVAAPEEEPPADPTRLIEGARVFLVPGPQFAAAARRRHGEAWASPPPSRVEHLAIVAEQPGNQQHGLAYAYASVPEAATMISAGPNATLNATIDALSTRQPGRPGLLQFSGHAQAGDIGLPADAHLVLDDGFGDRFERLYARDLVGGRFPNLSIPQTVVLSACSTWGDNGAADWLGLGPGFIWCGARNVVATLWPILDRADVAATELRLVQRLTADTRPPVDVVREFQLQELSRQREAPWEEEAWGNELNDLVTKANTYVWAAYAVVTVAAPETGGLTARHPATGPIPEAVGPNDLLPRASPPAGDGITGRDRSLSAEHAHRPQGQPARVRAGASDGRAGVRVEFGAASDKTRTRIKNRCGFLVRGTEIELSGDTRDAPIHTAFLRVTDAREAITRRELALDTTESRRVYPSWTGRFAYRIQGYGQIRIDRSGVAAVVNDPEAIDGVEVRPGLIAGIAVDFRDIDAVEVAYVGRDRASQTDELGAVRERPPGVDPKEPALLILRGHSRDGRRPFTVEMELDELGGRRPQSRVKAAHDCVEHVGVAWARSQRQRDDLTPEERARLARFAGGHWEHVVTWMRQRDTGVVQVGHEDDWVHTEWLYAGLAPPLNGTVGFGVPSASRENPSQPHSLDDELLEPATLDALAAAASRRGERPIGTYDILTAILDADTRGYWEAVQLHAAYVAREHPERYTDDRPGDSTWNGIPVSADAAAALAIAALISDTYDLRPMPPAVLGLGLVWDARSGAARALLDGSDADHAGLLRVIQDDVLGVDLQSLIGALPRPE